MPPTSTDSRLPIGRLGLLVAMLAAAAAVRLLVYRPTDGAVIVGWPAQATIRELRLLAVVVAAVAGASLGASGVYLQSLLRNPLASPFILGLSSGAALGVMAAIYLDVTWSISLTAAGYTAPAVLGALAALAVVFVLGQRRAGLDPLTLLLVGVVVAAICNALILCLQYLVPPTARIDLWHWMTGTINEAPGAWLLGVTTALAGLGIIAGARLGRTMDAATLTDDEARSVGVALERLRLWQFLLAGALAAGAVALTGPIGFIGLLAPHAARLVLGPRHAPLIIGSALAGAAWLITADALAQIIPVDGGRLPVGVFTALAGGPAFIWLLRRNVVRG